MPNFLWNQPAAQSPFIIARGLYNQLMAQEDQPSLPTSAPNQKAMHSFIIFTATQSTQQPPEVLEQILAKRFQQQFRQLIHNEPSWSIAQRLEHILENTPIGPETHRFFPNVVQLALQNTQVHDYLKQLLNNHPQPTEFETKWLINPAEVAYGIDRPEHPTISRCDFILAEEIALSVYNNPCPPEKEDIQFDLLMKLTEVGSTLAFKLLFDAFLTRLGKAETATDVLSLHQQFQTYYRHAKLETLYGSAAVAKYRDIERLCAFKLQAPFPDQQRQEILDKIEGHIRDLEDALATSLSPGICTPADLEALLQTPIFSHYNVDQPTSCYLAPRQAW